MVNFSNVAAKLALTLIENLDVTLHLPNKKKDKEKWREKVRVGKKLNLLSNAAKKKSKTILTNILKSREENYGMTISMYGIHS